MLRGIPVDLLREIAKRAFTAFNELADIKEQLAQVLGILKAAPKLNNGNDSTRPEASNGAIVKHEPNLIVGRRVETCPDCEEQTLVFFNSVKIGGNETEIWKCTNKLCSHTERR